MNVFFAYFSRIAVRQDTCAMVAISLNIQQKVHPIIWQYSNLPFDCFQAVAVKKPLGGTLIMAVNSLIYLNQSIPPYGVSLNSLTESSTNFPMSTRLIFSVYFSCFSMLIFFGKLSDFEFKFFRNSGRREIKSGRCTGCVYISRSTRFVSENRRVVCSVAVR